MIRRKDPGPTDCVVGYRNPPKGSQFVPGKSGNPKGRPKGSRTIGAVLHDILQQKLAVTESGKTRRIAALEVMLRRLVNDAVRSDPKAIKLLLSMVDRYGESPETKLRFDELLAEDQAILARFMLGRDGAVDGDAGAFDEIEPGDREHGDGG